MEYDIVIATRNRKLALELSIPLMLSQGRRPRRLIIVDSSDNHHEIRDAVDKIWRRADQEMELQIIRSEPGAAYQRNVGLNYVHSPVVMFPDDDSLWFPGVADAVMQIYERDHENLIGAVCGTPSRTPPPGIMEEARSRYSMGFRDRLQRLVGGLLDGFEGKLDPLFVEGLEKIQRRPKPVWLAEENAILVGPMTGFRMTFRTGLIREIRFDETLGRYSLFEDRDASLGTLEESVIVQANKAKIFHYRSPEKRVSGLGWGVMHILNRAYVVCKHSVNVSLARRLLKRYSYYKLGRYLLQAQSAYGRQRVIGAWRGITCLEEMLKSPREELTSIYLELRSMCLDKRG